MKKKENTMTLWLVLVFLTGLFLLLYPTVSDYWNSFHQSKAIIDYAEYVAGLDEETAQRFWSEAEAYNRSLPGEGPCNLTEEQWAVYENLLNASGNGIMGYIEIPQISCSLPIYHGTSQDVLEIAVGHVEGTSLPIGGESTHCALSGHRGLPSARLFTDLDQLVVGDTFFLRVLNETLTYEVDQILIVEPYEIEDVQVIPGEDYCTLITCTPYGINTQRMLVRGHRIVNQDSAERVRITADAIQIEPLVVAPLAAVPILLILLVALLIKTRKKKETIAQKQFEVEQKKAAMEQN